MEYLNDGSVVLNFQEVMVLDAFVKKVEVLKENFEALQDQFERLENIQAYTLTCRDAFEAENIRLRKQLEIDQFSAICKINNQLKTTSRWL